MPPLTPALNAIVSPTRHVPSGARPSAVSVAVIAICGGWTPGPTFKGLFVPDAFNWSVTVKVTVRTAAAL